MNYHNFISTYRRWRWTPRTSHEAFRDADYACALEVHVPTVKWKSLLAEAALGLIAAVAVFVAMFAVFRGVV